LQKGLEPGECYCIQHESVVRGLPRIDLDIQPPPDLAIEVDNTSSSINRMDIYRALGIPEVWRFDGETLTICCLVDGDYCTQETSQVLPILRRSDIQRFLQMSQTIGETSWIREFRQWIRKM
jgi:Uma2 family endonuclease